MSLVDVALLPVRVGLGIADAVLHAVVPKSPAPPSELFVVDGMPEGVPAAALRPELPAPAAWPFGEEFPRTCGTSRFAGGALFWTDFLYDDHGATGVPVSLGNSGAPPRGTYVYPDGPAARNGADIFRVAVGLTETDTWWRVDWNTLLDPPVPIALLTFDTDRATTTTDEWPAGAGVRSTGIDLALLVSASGARLIDFTTHASTPVETHRRHVGSLLPRPGTARVGGTRRHLDGAAGRGARERQGRRVRRRSSHRRRETRAAERLQRRLPHPRAGEGTPDFWSDQAQADALSDGDVSGVLAGRPVGCACRSHHHSPRVASHVQHLSITIVCRRVSSGTEALNVPQPGAMADASKVRHDTIVVPVTVTSAQVRALAQRKAQAEVGDDDAVAFLHLHGSQPVGGEHGTEVEWRYSYQVIAPGGAATDTGG